MFTYTYICILVEMFSAPIAAVALATHIATYIYNRLQVHIYNIIRTHT